MPSNLNIKEEVILSIHIFLSLVANCSTNDVLQFDIRNKHVGCKNIWKGWFENTSLLHWDHNASGW